MSSTLVETVPIQPPHTLYVGTPTVSIPRHAESPSPHEKLTAQLAHLASQHHASEYNRLKFGPKGATAKYVPLSVHMPNQVQELKARQTRCTTEKSWWLSDKRPSRFRTEFSCEPRITFISDGVDLKQELSAAMDSPLSRNLVCNAQFKTSETHPINISVIIPLELLPIVSFHLVQTRKPSPVLYDIPPPYHLDRVTSYTHPTQPPPPIMKPPVTRIESGNASPLAPVVWNRAAVAQALQAAMNTRLRGSFKARSLSRSRISAAPLQVFTDVESNTDVAKVEKALKPTRLPPSPIKSRKSGHSIGNLYLSSCPGKKVRLTGPVNGRVGVCRDLGRDLARIRELGVGCIVCCLDDNELEYLGVSWTDYTRIASENGIDILRIPTPEGLAPLEPRTLDSHLTRLIDSYTLQGIPILVHCRGGVGRAGLIACCWILKLGLCGWIDTHTLASTSTNQTVGIEDPIRRDTIQLVEKAIMIIRRRRSVKAVETFEQVLFLAEYVEYLRLCGSASMPDLSVGDDE